MGTVVDFYHSFFKFRAFVTLHPPKQHVFLEFLVENEAFYFTKRALRADMKIINPISRVVVS